MKKPSTCYMCSRRATSKEHAPPKCIFPEQKDSGGVDYRKNLVKVPSCELHNTQRSKEDEYLMYILPTSIAANDVGINQFLTKVNRAITRNPRLANKLTRHSEVVLLHDTKNNIWFNAPAIQIDTKRICKVIEMNARAIFYHVYGEKFLGQISVFVNFTINLKSPLINDAQAALFGACELLLSNSTAFGDNPEVFQYRLARDNKVEVVEFTFYGTSKALAVLQHS